MNLRYGEGMYFSQTSSKSNDYNAGSETTCTFNQGQRGANKRRRGVGGVSGTGTVQRRCMLLCKVALTTGSERFCICCSIENNRIIAIIHLSARVPC